MSATHRVEQGPGAAGIDRRRRACLGALLLAGTGVGPVRAEAAPGGAAPVAGPLERPATVLRDPRRAMLLGLARAGARTVSVGSHGVVLLSDDDGATWRQAASVPVSVTLTAVRFVTARVGWAVGHQGVVLRTDDAGEHWTRQLEGRAIAQLLLADAVRRGDARAEAEARRAVEEGADKPLLALHFRSEQEGLVVGAFGLVLATTDGGRHWTPQGDRLDNPKGAHLYTIDRHEDTVLIAGEQGLLLHSGDGGRSYRRVPTPYAGSYFGVGRDAAGAWVLAGLRGTVLRSDDQGRRWATLASPVPASVTALTRDRDGTLWLANQAGQLLRPTAAAAPLQLAAQTAAQQPADLLRLDDGRMLIAGWNGITRVSLR
ncbi:photosystem II stability/assembly factor-like uncharacterized protein [Sphaerotilus hippei]|uniref:Photosystem II stability/assembly factor-like uncharacterized protein n=1 Tax=Sphaerotilus hippei TaxID=744406 RepID=A0A318H2G3_9BURK|nr:YCF48-related protein [Sphaerotilus hippei]PXW97520.1 photosystem II stability/assembly factor-like uncharacterized protein [Sphaerotilus hippei]